jgi:hypothetical protein
MFVVYHEVQHRLVHQFQRLFQLRVVMTQRCDESARSDLEMYLMPSFCCECACISRRPDGNSRKKRKRNFLKAHVSAGSADSASVELFFNCATESKTFLSRGVLQYELHGFQLKCVHTIQPIWYTIKRSRNLA